MKDQLEAANPEPIIEEVVSADSNLSISTSVFGVFYSFGFFQDLANLAPRKPDW